MNIQDVLEIILITYNRKELLQKTFEQIFGEESPIRNFPITILDNKSTDGTAELIQQYKAKFPKIKHIINKRNIGGNANIIRAFELVDKKYFWILCDDDNYDWTHWNDIEQAILDDKDIILTEHLTTGNNLPIEVIVNELNFLPAGIYKSELLSDDVIHNAYANIYNSFPHQALVCECVNKNRTIFVPEHTVLIQNLDKGENMGYKRGYKENVHYRIAHFNLISGMVNSYQMIKDKNVREKCCGCLFLGRNFYGSMEYFLQTNGIYSYNICDIFNGVDFKKKCILLWAILMYFIKSVICFTVSEKGVYISVFNKLRTRILPRKLLFWVK